MKNLGKSNDFMSARSLYSQPCVWGDLGCNFIVVELYSSMPVRFNMISRIGNAKRFLAYWIVKRLKKKNVNELLEMLHAGVKQRESMKGQIHKVFQEILKLNNAIQSNLFF